MCPPCVQEVAGSSPEGGLSPDLHLLTPSTGSTQETDSKVFLQAIGFQHNRAKIIKFKLTIKKIIKLLNCFFFIIIKEFE